ncbi:phage head closure protein [Facklamia sp. P12945]|uniref:phage head closure protein n=1 Tax=Facklamia sp. P12945 TaxID=3421950 RepID=UPI003D16A767
MANKMEDLLLDGRLFFGEIKTERDAHRKVTGKRFVRTGNLFFNYVSINQRFDEYHVGHLSEVSLKVKVYFTKDIHKSHKVEIENVMYEILTMDPDIDRKYIYLFLKKVGELDANDHIESN